LEPVGVDVEGWDGDGAHEVGKGVEDKVHSIFTHTENKFMII
jgi:hypothetical protein